MASRTATTDSSRPIAALFVTAAVAIVGLLIVVPLVAVFAEAFAPGVAAWWRALADDPDTRHAIWLSLTVAPVAWRSIPCSAWPPRGSWPGFGFPAGRC
jgi:sulfate transport system permease protein